MADVLHAKHPVKLLEQPMQESPLIQYPGLHIAQAALVHLLQYENKSEHFVHTFELLYYPA